MQNSSDPTLATNVNPQSFKSQLKKLSGKSQSRKASKTGNAFDGVVDSKTAQTKPQVTKIKRLSGQEEPDNENDSSQNHASKRASADVSTNNLLPTNKEGADVGADSVTPVSNSVRIASLSMNEPQDSAKLFNTAFESQADTIVAQASMESTATIPAVASAPSFSLLGLGAGLGGLALAGGKGGSSGSSASSSSSTATPIASASISLSGFIAAGPIINPDGLKVEAFDASGNLLASTTSIQADGTFTVNLNNSYTGVIKVVVSDINGNTANFVDEATGRGKSFGADPLVTIFYLPAGQTTFSVNINPLTTEAANNVMAALRNDLTKATSAVISSANLDIATKYGISDASNQEELLTDPPLLLIDSKGVMNPKFDPYGLALAIKSVVDDNPSMSMKDAVIALAQNPLYSGWSDGPTNWASLVYGFGAGFLKNSEPTGDPSISGNATQGLLSGTLTVVQQGNVLTASSANILDADGMPNAATISYQWQASSDSGSTWSDIAGASGTNATTFTTSQDQVGKVVRVVATFTDNFGTQERVESVATASITNVNDLPRGNPDILEAVGLLNLSGIASRVPQQGKTLEASFGAINDPDGTPNATGAFSCQWQASTNGLKWFDIVGATDSTFTTTQTQVGQQLRVVAKYTDKLGTPETVYSNSTRAVANVNDLPTGLPTITGTPTQGNVLNASSTNIADADGMPNADAISYQWQTKISPAAAWTDITGASASTFTTTQDQVGKVVRVVATFTDNFGTQERVESDPTLRITNVNDLPTGKSSISGSATQGQPLTALSDNIADADGMPETSAISYNWQFSVDGKTWFFILGATSDTFTTTQAQLGKQVRVVATYTDKFGTPETVTSDPISIAPAISPLLFPNTSIVATAAQMGPTQTFAAGDVNGDGIADWVFAIGGIAGTITGIQKEMYVLFGNTSGTFDLKNSNDSKGFLIPLMSGMTGAIITYPLRATIVGYQNSIAGDFNGDGLGEIAVGTGLFVAEPIKTPNYISLVNQSTAITNSQLLLITGADRSFKTPGGFYAFDTGDMNGDGFSDLISGSYVTNTAHVFYGNTTIKSANVLQVDSLPANQGHKISDSQSNPDLLLFGVSSLGDANGDGYGDMAVAHNFSADPTLGSREEVFVIFGKQGLGNIDVNNIRTGVGSQGYVISADPLLPFLGSNMSLNATKVAGDFNGDGLKDLVLEGQNYAHTAAKFYVVFGKQSTTPINLRALGTNGFSIALPTVALKNVINLDLEMARDTVANCGDINGDGIDDMLVSLAFNTSDALPPFTVPGAPLPNAPTKTNHLLSYVVYGKTDLTDIDLNNLGNQGFKVFEGTKTLPMTRTNYFGNITSAGDINGDGLSDLIFDDYMGTNGGIPTIAFGSSLNQPISQWKVTHQGFGGNDTLTSSSNNLSETFIGGAGDDSIRGNGGADVMYGGAGDDVFYLNADNTNQLKSPMQANGRLARIDGGGGIDTLSLDGTDITLDLTSISNTRLQSIEKINLAGSGNTLKVSWQDIQNMTAMNLFNNTTTGWSGFSSNTMRYHQLAVDGQSTGSISFLTEGGWIKESFSALNINQGTAHNYNVYTNANHATQLLVSTNIGNVI
ncbi:MAG: hypothetical protein NTU46_09830 [Burkholderiales bacterium]|nr:hypothetical protein [Burkholderiales bacterium]